MIYKLSDKQRKDIFAEVSATNAPSICEYIEKELASQIRNDALEEAALAADAVSERTVEPFACSKAIRALKDKS